MKFLGKTTGDNNTRKRISQLENKARNAGDIDKKYDNMGKLSKIKDSNYEDSVGDMESFLDTKNRGEKQTIISPNQDYEAIHRVSPYKKTSLYFDRSPRITRR